MTETAVSSGHSAGAALKHWPTTVCVVCVAGIAAVQLVAPPWARDVLSGLLVVLVVLTALSQRRALHATLASLGAAHREQLDSESRYRALFDACSDPIFVYAIGDDGRPGPLVEANEAACVSLGYPRAQLLAMTADDIGALEVRRDHDQRLRTLQVTDSVVYETVLVTATGHRLPVELSARMVELRGRKLCLAIARNVAVRQKREGELRGMSHQDELTGLLNRRGFFAMVEQTRNRARFEDARILLLYADVDGLKKVNDDLGHTAGDTLITSAAEALRIAFRDEDLLARLGGDEFVALAVLGGRQDERLVREAILARLQAAVAAKRVELGERYDFSLSFGHLVTDRDELKGIDELLARSDERMYEAKRTRQLHREHTPARA